MTPNIARLCRLTNPDKCTNHGSKDYASTIMSNALVLIPLETQLARQGHTSVVSARPYGRANDISEKRLQDGLCAMPTNSKIVSLNATCTNPHDPPTSTPQLSRVTPVHVQSTKSPIESRELEIINLQKQLESLTKEKISLLMRVCNTQAEGGSYRLKGDKTILELKQDSNAAKPKFDDMMQELTVFKVKAKEEAIKREEESREALTAAMSAIIAKNNDNLRLEMKRDRDAEKHNLSCSLI